MKFNKSLLLVVVMGILVHAEPLQAGVNILLVPQAGQRFSTSAPLRVDVLAQLDAYGPESIQVRGLQFNLSDSSPGLEVATPMMHQDTDGNTIRFWNMSVVPACQADPLACGASHFFDGSLANDANLALIYTGLSPSHTQQLTLTQDLATRIGTLEVRARAPGTYVLDLFNADDSTFFNFGSWLAYGFGTTWDIPRVDWSAYDGTMTGGRLVLVNPEPGTLALMLCGALVLTRRNARRPRLY